MGKGKESKLFTWHFCVLNGFVLLEALLERCIILRCAEQSHRDTEMIREWQGFTEALASWESTRKPMYKGRA